MDEVLTCARYPTKIVLIRHAESAGNIDATVYAHTHDAHLELSANGHKQSRAVGAEIRRLCGDAGVQIICSPYRRTRQTVEGVLKGAAFPQESLCEVIEEPRLREQEFGNLQDPKSMPGVMRLRRQVGAYYFRFKEGESGADVYDRVNDCIEDLHRFMRRPRWLTHGGDRPKTLLVVAHGLTIRLFLMKWFHWTVDQFHGCWNTDTEAHTRANWWARTMCSA